MSDLKVKIVKHDLLNTDPSLFNTTSWEDKLQFLQKYLQTDITILRKVDIISTVVHMIAPRINHLPELKFQRIKDLYEKIFMKSNCKYELNILKKNL